MYHHCEFCNQNVHEHHVQRHLKSKKHLKASGMFDSLKSMYNNVVDRFKGKRLDGFNNESKKCIEKYNDQVIVSFRIAKKPIHNLLDKFINVLSLNKWKELKKEYGFDKLYHLCLIAVLNDGTKIYLEKIDAVTISTKDKITSNETTYLDVKSPNIKFGDFVNGSRSFVGDDKKYFDYNAWNNNCQVFVGDYLLKSINIYNKLEKDFIFQDVSEVSKKMPDFVKKIMNVATDAGQVANRLLGKGKIIKKRKKHSTPL